MVLEGVTFPASTWQAFFIGRGDLTLKKSQREMILMHYQLASAARISTGGVRGNGAAMAKRPCIGRNDTGRKMQGVT
jgi:hypothetical protein